MSAPLPPSIASTKLVPVRALIPAFPRMVRALGAAAALMPSAVVPVVIAAAATPVPIVTDSRPMSPAYTVRIWLAVVEAKRSSSLPLAPLSLISAALWSALLVTR